jgi:hypothetical protein
MAKWWEQELTPQPTSRLRRQPLSDDQFFAEQQQVEDELFRADRADDSQSMRALNQAGAQLRAAPKTVSGLARTLVGDEAGGQADLQEANRIIDREAEFAPDVQTLDDIESGSDALAYGRNAVLSNLPTIVPTVAAAIGTGGTSALIGAGLRGVAKRGLTRAVGNALTARTGAAAGAIGASSALQSNQMLDAALDDSTGKSARERAAAATVGAITTGALDALPVMSLLNRTGLGGAAKRMIAPELSKRLAKEVGTQALQEGSTEAIQTLGEKLTHKYVNENIDVLGPQAFDDYLNAFVAGGLVGGVVGAPAALRGPSGAQAEGQPTDARSKVKDTWNWFRKGNQGGPVPVDDNQPMPVDAEPEQVGDIAEALRKNEAVADPNQPSPPGVISALFGKNQDLFNDIDEESAIDSLFDEYSQADRGGRATGDEIGLVGKDSENFGFVRGPVPFEAGKPLFDASSAQSIFDTARESGRNVSTLQAYAMSAIGDSAKLAEIGDDAVKAGALFLATGDRSNVDEGGLRTFIEALGTPDKQRQFIFAADRFSELLKTSREKGELGPLSPKALRAMMDGEAAQPLSEVEADEKVTDELRTLLSDDAEGAVEGVDFDTAQGMAEERPAPVSLNEVVGALPFVDARGGARDGALRVINSKGNPRDVSLASLVAQGWQAAKDGVFTAPNGVVDVVAQAIDTLQQRGLTVDPNQIKAGLWLGGDTRLTPQQAATIRNGMQPARQRPVQETPGLPASPTQPFSGDNVGSDTGVQGEDGIENLAVDDTTLRPRTRSPLGLRVSPEGRVTEAETIDTAAADDVSADQRVAENDAIAALHRANEVVAPGTKLKGRDLDTLMENFGKRVAGLKTRTPEQDAAIRGARRAIQRIERGTFNDLDFAPDDLVEAANAPIDLAREQELLNALTDKLGMERITLEEETGFPRFGAYSQKLRTVWLSDKRTGNARLDTLLHELGHAVVMDKWTTLDREQQDAIAADYRAWQMEAGRQRTREGARKTRAPFFIKQWLDQRPDRSPDLGDLTEEQLEETLSFDEYLADQLARALGQNTETRGVVGQFFTDLAAKLRELYELFAGSKYEPSATIEGWVQQLLDAQKAQTLHTQPLARQQEMAEVYADENFSPPPAQPQGQAANPANLFSLLNDRDRGVLERTLADRGVREQIYQYADEQTQRQLNLYGPDLRALINTAAAMYAEGRLDLKAGKGALNRLVDMVRTTLGLPKNADVAQQILADHQANQITRGRYDAEGKAFDRNAYTRTVHAVQRGVTRVVQPVMDKLTVDIGTRMRDTNVPALRKLATLIETRNAENAGEESFNSRYQRFTTEHSTAYMEAVAGLKDEQKRTLARALQANVRPTGQLGQAFDKVTALFEQYRLWSNANGVTVRKRKDYFPVVMDSKAVEDNWDELAILLSKPEYEADIRQFFNDNKTGIGELVQRMVQIAQTADVSHVGEVDFSLGQFSPAVTAQRAQIMGFITSKLDRPALAKFQTDSLDAIMIGYARQMAKKAAFVKTFGTATETTPNRIGQLIAAAERQGATSEQLKMARDFVNMAVGSYRAELNPAIRWVFDKVDKVWGTELAEMPIEQWAHYQQFAQTYQNVRLLGLAALSSLIDPLGSLVRGGSVSGTLRSMWDAAQAMRADGNDLRAMAESMGIVEKYALSDAMAATYGGSFDPQGKLGKINNALFKFNGLEAITRHSRLTALAMGHRFLIRHSQTPNEHSERLLAELGLEASDVQVDDRGFVELNPKTEQALRRFATESVVRPQPSQRPGWHNDPNFMFASQYKGYLHAFYTTIVDRMLKEADQGNYRQALVPLIPYLGVTMAAEMVRHAIQNPGDEPPELDALMQKAMVRSGLVGPRFGVFNDARTDTRYGSWVTNSWIGPSGQQVTDLVDVATGERSFGKTAIEALPGSAIFEDWNISNEQPLPADPA